MNEQLMTNMLERMERCRRLANQTHDDRASKALREMAEEIEADLKRLKADGAVRDE
jgi:hypothetical protein